MVNTCSSCLRKKWRSGGDHSSRAESEIPWADCACLLWRNASSARNAAQQGNQSYWGRQLEWQRLQKHESANTVKVGYGKHALQQSIQFPCESLVVYVEGDEIRINAELVERKVQNTPAKHWRQVRVKGPEK